MLAPVTATFTRSGYNVCVLALLTSTAAVLLLDQSHSDFRRRTGPSFGERCLKHYPKINCQALLDY